ncbi:MAG TPA: aminoacyl-tRNA hydrolase [Planctomycetota bacterium]|nr:aminoacyl-tRNA hydrolase [Planctomycetota bacterium]HUV39326.1 aminoacyl-tRNA hydrolase [Planctomycetota bacterium]
MKVVVGIGNPGSAYAGTRHNVGFDVVDRLAEAERIDIGRRRFDALVGEGTVAGERVVLLKPQTFVNLSGRAVRSALDWWKLTVDALLVVCDDANLPLGKLRFRREGSSGGHNGLASIVEHLGTESWARLRIGIGRREGDLVDHVLGRFSASERQAVDESCIDAVRGVLMWIAGGVDACMNAFNG